MQTGEEYKQVSDIHLYYCMSTRLHQSSGYQFSYYLLSVDVIEVIPAVVGVEATVVGAGVVVGA